MKKQPFELDRGRMVAIDDTADLMADFGRETYLQVYERFKNDAEDLWVSKLDPAEEGRVDVGDPIHVSGQSEEYEVVELMEDEVSGLEQTISPGRIVIIRRRVEKR